MKQYITMQKPLFTFSKWTRKSNATFLSLNKVIKIACLSLAYNILTWQLCAQTEPGTISFNQNIDLEEIEVIGQLNPVTLKQNARFVTVIDSQEINVKPVTSFQDILEYVPGVDLRQRNENGVQADVSIRGGTFDQVMVLLNGVNITDAQTGHHNLNLPINANDIKRVEILHGPGARVYGADAFSGAINFVTKTNPDEIFQGGITGGQHGLVKAYASTGFKTYKVHNYLSGSYSKSDGYTHNTDFKRFNVFYNGHTTIRKSVASLQFGLTGKGFGANSFYTPRFLDQYEETNTTFASVSLDHGIKNPFHLSAYWRRHNDHFILIRDSSQFRGIPGYDNYHQTNLYGVNSDIRFSSRLGTSTVGANIKVDEIRSNLLGEELSADVLIRGTDSTYFTHGATTYQYHLFAEHSYSADRFYASVGLMAGSNSFLEHKIKLYPGLDLSYWIFEEMKLSGSIQRTLRTPTYTDLYYMDPSNRGNEDLRPEEAIGADVGFHFYKGHFTWQTFYYHQFGNNLIVWAPVENYRLAQNIDTVQFNGVESRLEYRSANHWIRSVNIGYAYNNVSKAVGEVPDILQHKFTAGVHHQFTPDISFYWNVRYMERIGTFLTYDFDEEAYGSSSFEPYWLVDAKLSYRYEFLNFFINATNLLDTKYHEITSLSPPGRWFKIGAEIKLKRNEMR